MKKTNRLRPIEMKRLTIVLIIQLGIIYASLGCSCTPHFFCDYLNDPLDEKVVIKGKVIQHKIYNEFHKAVYIEVTNVFRDDTEFGITDTLKLWGSVNEAGCKVDTEVHFKENEEIFLAIGLKYMDIDLGFEIVDPDDEGDQYWSFGLHLCFFTDLKINQGIVSGLISEDERIFEYPLDQFESRLAACNFTNENLNGYKCSVDDFVVYPNPSSGDLIEIRNKYRYTAIDEIVVYGLDGKVQNIFEYEADPEQRIKLTIENSGLYILEIICGGEKYYRKIVVEK